MAVLIKSVTPRSPAAKAGVKAGETLAEINGHPINDTLDYGFYCYDRVLELNLVTRKVKVKKKDDYDDIGLNFETYLMDEKKSCRNKCIFCFIDQLPKGMRDTLYFKDDDSRLSFLQGNYITLTNLSEEDIERIIKMKLNVNVSVHTTNPELRCKMLNNRFAGEVLRYIDMMAKGGITMNCQIVLCRDINDGEELKKTLSDLTALYPAVKSIAVVPFGATKYREGLPKIELHNKETARETIEIINSYGEKMLKEYGERVVFPADEFFVTAEMPMPEGSYYESYDQYENGVGMWTYYRESFLEALSEAEYEGGEREFAFAVGTLSEPLMRELSEKLRERFPKVKLNIFAVKNEFFGETVTVSGLVTGGDLINCLLAHKTELGEALFIPKNMLKADEDIFLDDVRLSEVEERLGIPVIPVSDEGYDLLDRILS